VGMVEGLLGWALGRRSGMLWGDLGCSGAAQDTLNTVACGAGRCRDADFHANIRTCEMGKLGSTRKGSTGESASIGARTSGSLGSVCVVACAGIALVAFVAPVQPHPVEKPHARTRGTAPIQLGPLGRVLSFPLPVPLILFLPSCIPSSSHAILQA